MDVETKSYTKKRDCLKQKIKENALHQTKLESELNAHERNKSDMESRIQDYVTNFPWITEKRYLKVIKLL